MFANLKAAAQDAAVKAQEAATKAYEAGKERVETGMAGKKLLDEGGEEMKTKMLAKKASRDLVQFDASIMTQLPKIVADYRDASSKLQSAASSNPEFSDLGKAYAARADELNSGYSKLQASSGARQASISPVESDAISILTAKGAASGFGDKVRSTVAGSSSTSTNAGYTNDQPPVAPSEEPKKSILETAQDKAKEAADKAKQRLDTANTGKKMVDEGGEQVAAVLLAKKASIDTTAFDTRIVELLTQAVASYKEAEHLTRQSLQSASGESPSFSDLEADFKRRGDEFEAFLSSLAPIPRTLDASQEEKDGIMYLSAKLGVKSATDSATAMVKGAQTCV
jgi:hypothetical protein